MVVVLLALLLFMPVLQQVPHAVLAAIVLVAVIGLLKPREFVRLWHISRVEAAIAGTTFVVTLVGAFIGGVLSMRLGVMRILMLGAVLSAASNLLFAWLAGHGHDVTALIAVVSADNLASGIASAAFIAYLSSLTNVSYSATQYALFSSMMLLLPKFVAGFSGDYVDAFGYAQFSRPRPCWGFLCWCWWRWRPKSK